jgi:hypothetical protein
LQKSIRRQDSQADFNLIFLCLGEQLTPVENLYSCQLF